MHVQQTTEDGCLFACVAMLRRASGRFSVSESEEDVRSCFGVGSGPGSYTSAVFRQHLRRAPTMSLLDMSNIYELAAFCPRPAMLIVNAALAHNLAFPPPPGPLPAVRGSLLPYAEPVHLPETGMPHAMVLADVDEGNEHVVMFDPWYDAVGQPVRLPFDRLLRFVMDGPFVLR